MMIDGSTCWIEQAAVDLTEVELVQNTQAQPGIGRPDIVQAALAWLGTPYKYGGTSARGIDCSALVMNVYRQFGVRLPRTAREQYQVGQVVTWDQLLPGDRLYFTSSGGAIDHTGLYMGDGQFVHASGRRGMVGIDSLGDASYWRMFVGAKR
jgi:cell wall-associated NlpC family hydrolase